MEKEKKLFLLDAMPLLYRGHFIFMRNPRITSKGLNASALYGYTNSLVQILETEQPTHIAVAFDTPEPTFRHERYPEYKAQREAMPEDLAKAIPLSHDLTRAFNIPMLTCPGFEADDIVGTITLQADEAGFKTYMVTPDKDYAQLVTPNTFLYIPGKGGAAAEILGIPEVLEKWGLERIDQMIDILGLAGDAVDNLPGIPGIGEKTAIKLLQQFGDLESLLESTEQLKGKQKEKVETFADQARLCRELATIARNVPLDVSLDDLARKDPDEEALTKMVREFELTTLGKRVLGKGFALVGESKKTVQGEFAMEAGSAAPSDVQATEESDESFKSIVDVTHSYHLVKTSKDQAELINALKGADAFCFDLETTGLDARNTDIVGFAFAIVLHEAYYIPMPPDKNEAEQLLDALRPAFKDPGIEKIGHNLKFDIGVLQAHGVQVEGSLSDTMLAHYVLEPEHRHGMDHLSRTFLSYSPVPITSLIGERGKDQKSIADIPVEEVADYAAEDADVTLQLQYAFVPLVKKAGAVNALKDCENPLIRVLIDMEAEGIRLDSEALHEYSKVLAGEIADFETRIYEEAGTTFNIGSPKQLGEVLFDYMKIEEKAKKTRTGQYATNEEVLTGLAAKHKIAELVLDYRHRVKLKSTYVDALPEAVDPNTGRVHTTYSQAVTATGRIQSHNPNLQNIPIRSEKGREIRKAFVPRDGAHVLLSADYSQIELRVMAELSGDKAMHATFRDGHDVHAATASRVNGVALEDVTDEMRRQAKMVNFGIIYGISAFGLGQRLHIPRNESAQIIDEYFRQYPDVKAYMDKTIESAREHGYVTTMMGRRRSLPDIQSRNATVRQAAERNAINTPIQGTAADMIKIAMVNIHKALNGKKLKSRMLLQVHDELVFDVHRTEEESVKEIVETCMKSALPVKIPIVIHMGIGDNWLEAH